MSGPAERLYRDLGRLKSHRETNPHGVIQSREAAELLIAVRAVDLAAQLKIIHDDQFTTLLQESLELRHPFRFFIQRLVGVRK